MSAIGRPAARASVCLITGEYPPAIGGIADYTASLARWLQAEGLAVAVCTTEAPNRSEGNDGIAVLRVPGWGIRSLGAIVAAVERVQPDVVHLQYQAAAYSMSPAIVSLPYAIRARSAAAFVTTFHDLRPPYLFPKAGPLRRWFNHALIGASDAAIFTEPADLTRAHPRRPAFWIPIASSLTPAEPLDRDAARRRFGLALDDVVIASFGFVNSSKGLDTLLRASERLVRARVPLRLLFIGDETGSSDPRNEEAATATRALTESLGLEDHVIRTGLLSDGEVSLAMAAADLAALPYRDGASLRRSSLLTCLAHGLPVVTTEPGPRAAIHHGNLISPFDDPGAVRIGPDVVALVPRGDDAALARELYRLLDDPARRAHLAAAGKALADRLSWPSIARATRAVYERTIQGRPRSAATGLRNLARSSLRE